MNDDPIVIVGMGCRFPGGVRDPEDLWELLTGGEDAISRFPVNRGWNTADVFDDGSDPLSAGYAAEGGFIYDAGDFDPAFFGISPREALSDGPAAAVVAGDVLGGAGAGRDRPGHRCAAAGPGSSPAPTTRTTTIC